MNNVLWLLVLKHHGAERSKYQLSKHEPDGTDKGNELEDHHEGVSAGCGRKLVRSLSFSKKSLGAGFALDAVNELRLVEGSLVLDHPNLLVNNLGGLNRESSREDGSEIVLRLEVNLSSTVWLQVLSGDDSSVLEIAVKINRIVDFHWLSWSREDLLHLVLDLLEIDNVSVLLTDTISSP